MNKFEEHITVSDTSVWCFSPEQLQRAAVLGMKLAMLKELENSWGDGRPIIKALFDARQTVLQKFID